MITPGQIYQTTLGSLLEVDGIEEDLVIYHFLADYNRYHRCQLSIFQEDIGYGMTLVENPK